MFSNDTKFWTALKECPVTTFCEYGDDLLKYVKSGKFLTSCMTISVSAMVQLIMSLGITWPVLSYPVRYFCVPDGNVM
jgi:hypothetical protein